MKKFIQFKNSFSNKIKVLSLAFIFILGTNFNSKACTPMAIPTLTLQSIGGGSLQLTWISNTLWACEYLIEVELVCNGAPFTGAGPFINSASFVKPSPAPLQYPTIQAINLGTLCPGTTYQFRAREAWVANLAVYSGWTPTFSFTTPGAFVLPIIQPIPNPTICPSNTTQLTASLQSGCGPGPITYSWAPAAGLSCLTCSNPIANPTVQTSYTVTVKGGPLSCWTATNAVTVYTSSGSAQVLATAIQLSCTNTLTAVSLTTAGTATAPISITWSPTPGSVSGNSLNATGLPVGVTTVVVVDQVGCVKTTTILILPAPPPVTFTINNLSPTYSITCLNPSVNLQAVSNYTYGTLSYNWTSPSYTSNINTATLTAPVNLTLTVTDNATGCQMTQTVAVGINTTAPTNSVSPPSQAITCATVTPVTFSGTCTNPTVNLQHDWYSPLNPLPGGVPIATSNNTISILSGVIPPGVYTLQTTNLVNGCKAFKTVTVTSLDAWPTFGINSSTNYSVGCSPLNQTTLSIINPVSTQTPPATCSFTFLPPGFGGTLAPGPYSGNSSTITIIPGTWTVIVNDNSNNCKTYLSVPIIQNTVAPHVAVTTTSPNMSQTLTCYNPTLLATGSSTTTNAQINWLQPIAPPLVSTATILIGPGSGPNTSTTSLTYANYTVVSTNTVNACATTSVVVISQNFKVPVSSPTISIGTPTAIYCTVANNPAVLTTGSSTTTSGGGPTAFAVPVLWEGPSPQATTTGVSSYSCYVPGIYSLTIMDNYNGCIKTGTINVLDRTQPPVITTPVGAATLDCGTNGAQIQFVLTGTNAGGLRYVVTDYPLGASFTPTDATIFNINPLLSGTNKTLVTVSDLGTYIYMVSNTLTGCRSEGTVIVTGGGLNADFDANPPTGYAPLTVNFNNTTGTSSISSVWSFGNGTSLTTTNGINPSVEYTSPGTYTVMLLISKGSCLDTVYKTVVVDLPSKLDVPNVFTPNGDGSNDVFFLKTANLTDISAIIFDRWGNKVYETNSSTGNIAWDGKNAQGKECSSGTYFYVITATGKDAKEYKTKGNVSLYR